MLDYLALGLSAAVISGELYKHIIKPKRFEKQLKIDFLRNVERYKRRAEACREMGFESESQKWEETAKSLEQYYS